MAPYHIFPALVVVFPIKQASFPLTGATHFSSFHPISFPIAEEYSFSIRNSRPTSGCFKTSIASNMKNKPEHHHTVMAVLGSVQSAENQILPLLQISGTQVQRKGWTAMMRNLETLLQLHYPLLLGYHQFGGGIPSAPWRDTIQCLEDVQCFGGIPIAMWRIPSVMQRKPSAPWGNTISSAWRMFSAFEAYHQ